MEHNIYFPVLQIQAVTWNAVIIIVGILLPVSSLIFSAVIFAVQRRDKKDNDLSKYAKTEDLKELDKRFCDNLADFKNDNTKSHAEMKADITMVETRLTKRGDEIKSDFVDLVKNLDRKFDMIFKKMINEND